LGVVTALTPGTAKIKVTTQAGGHSDSCLVTVTPRTIPTARISLDKSNISLSLGEHESLTATVLPENATDKSVTWVSSNPGAVTVEAGTLMAVGSGAARITATTADGNNVAACEVAVVNVYALGTHNTYLDDGWDNSGPVLWKNGAILEPFDPDFPPISPNAEFEQWFYGRGLHVTDAGDVFVAGKTFESIYSGGVLSDYHYHTVVLKNGQFHQHVATQSYFDGGSLQPENIFVSGNDVYLVGMQTGAGFTAKLYKNGVEQELRKLSGSNYSWGQDVFVANGRTYVVGSDRNTATGRSTIVLWTDGIPQYLADSSQEHPGSPSSVYVSGTDVYVGGAFRATAGGLFHPTVWKNGVPTQYSHTLGNLEAIRKIVVSGGDVHAVGEHGMSGMPPYLGMTAMYWKNGVGQILHPYSPNVASQAYSVDVIGEDVYVFGEILADGITRPVLWKNGVLKYLSDNGSAFNHRGLAVSKSQSASGLLLKPEGYPTAYTGNPIALAIDAGTSRKLLVETIPYNASNAVGWESTNNNVATISSDGTLRAIAPGNTTITAKSLDGGATATCAVTVAPATRVTGVALNTNTANLTVNYGTITLTSTIAPANASNRKVRWSSSDESRIRVDYANNLGQTSRASISAIREGSAYITVTTEDGQHTATCLVTATVVPVTGVTLNLNEMEVAAGATKTLTITLAPTNTSERWVEITSDNPDVARPNATTAGTGGTVGTTGSSTITIYGIAPGKATFTVTTQRDQTATCVVTVTAAGSIEVVPDDSKGLPGFVEDEVKGKPFFRVPAIDDLLTETTN
jgi:uncharacterized protein YjdB